MPDNFEPFFQNRRCRPGCPFFPPCRCDRDRRDDRREPYYESIARHTPLSQMDTVNTPLTPSGARR